MDLIWERDYVKRADGLSLVNVEPAIVNHNSIIISPDETITSINRDDGKINWSYSLPENGEVGNNFLLYDSQQIYTKLDDTKRVLSHQLLNGEVQWEAESPTGHFTDLGNDAQDQNNLYLVTEDFNIHVFSKAGSYKKSIKLDKVARSIAVDGNALFVTQAWKPSNNEISKGKISALNLGSDSVIWTYETNSGGYYFYSMLLDNDYIYAGVTSGPGEFVALNAADGTVLWRNEGLVSWSYTLSDSMVFVNDSVDIVALDRFSGQVLWRTGFGGGHGQNNIAYLNGFVYHAHSSSLFVLDAQTGEIVHQIPQSPDGSPFGNLAAADGKVFVQSDHALYCYRAWE